VGGSWDAPRLRREFTDYFVARGHAALPAAGLVPTDPTVLFTIAGMVQFKPYFTGELPPPVPRATTVQPCVRTVDLDLIGTTARHMTFFEMLGNFSFGDYFKREAIVYAWELVTGVLGLDPGRLWVTVHESDEEAAAIWRDEVGVAPGRVQAMGADNFWQMGETGPCGPCSEIYYDRGPAFGEAGGPAGGAPERYVEVWNLVFMQYERFADGSMQELPRKSIDTGAGLERLLAVLEDVPTVFDTDVVAPVLDAARRATGHDLEEGPTATRVLRLLADHARTATFLVAEGVFPSNEGRGYVLRRVLRRAVLRAHQLGVEELVLPGLAAAVVETLGGAYPRLERERARVEAVLAHEEEGFRRTLRAGAAMLEEALAGASGRLSGEVAFRLHDTYGFPIELTEEVAAEQGVEVDREGFDAAMGVQRERARAAARRRLASTDEAEATFAELLARHGPTEFLGYRETSAPARVLAVLVRPEGAPPLLNVDGERVPPGRDALDLVLDRTPFYAEGGGQVGDTGIITTSTGRFRVLDTTSALEGLTRHSGYLLEGEVEPGQEAYAEVDRDRREAIRRNHTATHLLHAALRRVLGPHVQQQGSLVAPDRLRFDFSHFAAPSAEELDAVEDLVNEWVLADEPVRTYETSRRAAEEAGAVAFFGEKYGEVVRVVEAGGSSVELCGGTHVRALGMIGSFRIVSEGSIGSNTRRVEAVTGLSVLGRLRAAEATISSLAGTLRTSPAELPAALERLVARTRALEEELRELRARDLAEEAGRLADAAVDGRLVARRDGLDATALRELALSLRQRSGLEAVALAGSPDGERATLVVAVDPASGLDARRVVARAAAAVGGGGGGSPQLATAGGRDPAGLARALELLAEELGGAVAGAAATG